MPPSHPFYGTRETVYHRAIVSGYGPTFRPGYDVTRAQLSKLRYQALHQ